MAYGQNSPIDCPTEFLQYIWEIEYFTGLHARSIMVNTLEPKRESPKHTDPGTYVRYHYPIQTNPSVFWWDEVNQEVHMKPGFWYGPIPYNNLHAVYNRGETPRIHLIVDLEYQSVSIDQTRQCPGPCS